MKRVLAWGLVVFAWLLLFLLVYVFSQTHAQTVGLDPITTAAPKETIEVSPFAAGTYDSLTLVVGGKDTCSVSPDGVYQRGEAYRALPCDEFKRVATGFAIVCWVMDPCAQPICPR